MKSLLVAIILSATAAFGAAAYYFKAEESPPTGAGPIDTNTFDPTLPVEARIDALEKAVSDERLARQLLQDEVFYLTNELDRLTAPERFAPAEEISPEAVAESEPEMSRDERRRRARSRARRSARCQGAGAAP